MKASLWKVVDTDCVFIVPKEEVLFFLNLRKQITIY